MNVFWRVLWKEYRTQRVVWLAVFAIAIALQWFFVLATPGEGPRIGPFAAAVVLSILYALASSAMLFALEREERTRELLHNLAAPAAHVLAGKFCFALGSSVLMLLLLSWLAGIASVAPLPVNFMAGKPWQIGSLISAEVLLWGLTFSLLTGRVLTAVGLATLAALASHSFHPYQLYALPLLLVVDVWLARRWMADRRWQWPLWFSLTSSPERVRSRAPTIARETTSPWRWQAKRLIWQECRHARTFLGIYGAMACVLLLVSGYTSRTLDVDFAYLILPNTPFILGLLAFQAEQRDRRFRFLANRGIAPGAVWLSKHVVWLTAAVLMTLLFAAMHALAELFWHGLKLDGSQVQSFWSRVDELRVLVERIRGPQGPPISIVGWVALYLVLCYSVGQFVSLFLSRAITALLLGLVLTYTLLAWSALMVILQVPLLWSVVPIPLAFITATWLRTPDWMLERNNVRGSFAQATVLTVSAGLILLGVAAWRVWEVPGAGPGFAIETISVGATPDEAERAALYHHAASALAPWPSESGPPKGAQDESQQDRLARGKIQEQKWLDLNQQTIELALTAAWRFEGVFFQQHGAASLSRVELHKAGDLGRVLVLSAQQTEARGELDKALERYVAALRLARHLANRGGLDAWMNAHWSQQAVFQGLPRWAAHPQQDAEKIDAAMERIEQETANFTLASDALKMEYLAIRAQLSPDSSSPPTYLVSNVLERFAPWEKTRALRVLDAITASSLSTLNELEDLLGRPGTDLARWQKASLHSDDIPLRGQNRTWVLTTPSVSHLVAQRGWLSADDLASIRIDLETRRRACLLTLALVRWRLDKGQLPPRLDDLGGQTLHQFGFDPWSGDLFGYRPEGFPSPVKFQNMEMPPGRPLLWSAGASGARVIPLGQADTDQPRYITVVEGRPVKSISHPSLTAAGQAFPIP